MQEILEWFAGVGPALTHLFLCLSSLVEYVFPPFPGDTVTLAGAALSATAGYSWWSVWAVLTMGSTIGSVATWAFGRSLGRRRERWPKFLRTPSALKSIDTLEERFEKRGAIYLAINRFVPAFRALFFVAAGVVGLPLRAVLVWGTLSAALWNGGVLALGFSLGSNVGRLEAIFHRYQNAALLLMAFVVSVAFVVWLLRRMRSRAAG